jgi:WD40 repeat protein
MAKRHMVAVNGMTVTLGGLRAVSGSRHEILRLWDLRTGQTICSLEGHTDRANAIAVMADGRRAVSVSEDRALRAWNPERERYIASFDRIRCRETRRGE